MLNYVGIFNEHEIWNAYRTETYLNNGLKPNCLSFTPCAPKLPVFCDDPSEYTLPDTDNAPWYYPSYPESAEFAGVIITDIPNLDSVFTRETGDSLYGGWAGAEREGLRTLTITGTAYAKTCRGLKFGIRWFERKLAERDECDCAPSNMWMYDCCPSQEDLTNLTEQELISKYMRGLYNTVLVGGIKVTEKFGDCCDSCDNIMARIQFTIAVLNPGIYSRPEKIISDGSISGDCVCNFGVCDPCFTPTTPREVEYTKTRLPIEIRETGEWCPIGWDIDNYAFPLQSAYFDITNIVSNIQYKPVRVKPDGTFEPIGWTLGDVDLCDTSVVIGEVCTVDGPVSGCEVINLGDEIRRIKLNSNGTYTPLGWTVDENNFPGSNIKLELDCPCVNAESLNARINVNEDLTWNFYDYSSTYDLYKYSSLTIDDNASGTYTIVENVPVENVLAPCDTTPYSFPTLKRNYCYCEPLSYKESCYKIEITDDVEKKFLVGEFDFISTVENFSLEIFKVPSNIDFSPCDTSDEAKAYWACRKPCAGFVAKEILGGLKLYYDSSSNSMTLRKGNVDVGADRFIENYYNNFYTNFNSCGNVYVRVRAKCSEDTDIIGVSFDLGLVRKATVSV